MASLKDLPNQIRDMGGKMPFSEAELAEFTKTERRILNYIHVMRYDEPEILRIEELQPNTLRWHMSKIKRKVSVIRTKRFEARTAQDVGRQKSLDLPQFVPGDAAAPVASPPVRIPRARKARKPIVATAEDMQHALDQHLPLPATPLSHKRFFTPAEPPPIPAATASLPPTFHPEKPALLEFPKDPVMQSMPVMGFQQSSFGSFKRLS